MINTHHSREYGNLLPEGWVSCHIKDVAIVNPKKIEANPELTAGFVPMSHAPTGLESKLAYEERTWGEIQKNYTNFKDGDVIFAKVTPCFENGKAAIVDGLPNGIGAGSSEFYVLRPNHQLVKNTIIFSLIKTFQFAQSGASSMTGAVGLRRVPRKFVENYSFSLPPLAEQQEIARQLDTLLAQVVHTQARLQRIPDILKHFRQSVLADAVSGKLTETADSESFQPLGNVDVEIKTGPFGSALHKSDYVANGIPVVNPMHITEGTICPSFNMSITKEKFSELANWQLQIGDVVVGRRGEMGRAATVTKTPMLCGTGSMFLRPSTQVNSKYLEIILRSPTSINFFNAKSVGTTMVNLNQKIIKSLKVYFPSLEEQSQIVARVEQLFAYADRIEQQAQAALERVNLLSQSILAKAFRGELTAQWRAENPDLISGENSAEALLAKIQAERSTRKKGG